MASLDDIQGAYSTSQLQTMCEQGRLLFNTASDRLSVVAAELRVNLAGLGGNPMLLGLDSRAAARRVTRNLVHAAALQHEAARAMQACWFTYQGLYLAPKPASNKFDVAG